MGAVPGPQSPSWPPVSRSAGLARAGDRQPLRLAGDRLSLCQLRLFSVDDDHRRWPPVVRRARSRDRRSRRKRWSGNPGQRIRHRLSGPCRWSIDEAALGSNAWSTVDFPATTNHVSAQLARQGSASYTLFPGNLASGAGSQQAELYISQDGGAQWSHQSDPCGSTGSDPDDAQAIAAAPDRVLAVLCAPRHGGPGCLIVATDAGASYGNREKVPLAGGSQLAAASLTSLLVGNAGELGPSLYRYRFRLFHSNDGGRPWRAVVDQDSGVSQVIPESWDSRPSPTAGGSPPPAPFGLPPTPEPAGPDRDFSGRPRPVSSLPAPG